MLSVLDSDKRLADHFGGKVSLLMPSSAGSKLIIKLHLGYQELRRLLADIAEARMQRQNRPPPTFSAPPNAPSGPSGPSAPNYQNNYGPPPGLVPPMGPSAPRTPNHGHVPPADELPVVGHGDKVKREAGELVEDVKESRRESSRDESDKYESRREDRYREREREDKYESRRRYDDDRRDRRYE